MFVNSNDTKNGKYTKIGASSTEEESPYKQIEEEERVSQKAFDLKDLREAIGNRNPIDEASLFSRFMFSWTSPVLGYAQRNQLDINELGTVRKESDVRLQKARLMKEWLHYKDKPGKNGMLKAVMKAYRREYCISTFFAMLVCCLQIVSPFLLKALIDYIKMRSESTIEGLILVGLLALSQGMVYIVQDHVTFYSRMTGVKSTNAMIAVIYDKMFKISSATNKKFSEGQLINFV